MTEDKATQPLLDVRNLKTYFYTEDGVVRAVDGVDITVAPGEVLGIVGESGCGKSVTSLSIMRLIGQPGKIIEGEIFYEGKDLLKLTESEMMKMRGNRISMIFQQPQTSLNPVFKVGEQISEVLNIHQDFGKEAGHKRAVDLLKQVGIPDAERRADIFPHPLNVWRNLWLLEHYRRIDVFYFQPDAGDELMDMPEENEAGNVFEALIRIGEVLSDVTKGCGPQQCVTNGVTEHIGIGMPLETPHERDVYPSKDQLPIGNQPMNIISKTDPHS